MLSAKLKAEADNIYQDLDYFGYYKNQIYIVLLYFVLKKIMTNTLSKKPELTLLLCVQPTD